MSEGKAGQQSPQLEMFAVWQKMMSESMETLLRSPLFLAAMGKGLENSLLVKEQVDKSLQAYLQALNLPSTKDVQRVLEGLRSLQAEVEALRAKVDQLLEASGGRKGSRPAKRQEPRRRRGDGRKGSD